MDDTVLDRGWAWVVMIAAFGCNLINAVAYSLGVYVAELIAEQELDGSSVALFGSLQMAVGYLSIPLSYVSERTSHRLVLFVSSVVAAASTVASIYIKSMTVLYVTFGVIPGFCSGAMCLQSIIIMNRYFKKRTGLANSITLAGCATGMLFFSPLFRAMIMQYGWRFSLYIVAGIVLQGCVFAACMRPVKNFERLSPQLDESLLPLNKPIFRNPTFYSFVVGTSFWAFSFPVVFVFAPSLFHENNIDGWQIDLLMTLMGASNLIARLMSGLIFSMVKWNMIAVNITMVFYASVTLILFVVHSSVYLFYVAAIFFGISFGCHTCTLPLIVKRICGMRQYSLAFSTLFAFCAFGHIFGPFLSGYIYEATGSYSAAFFCSAGIAFFSGTVLVGTFYLDRKSLRHVQTAESCITEHTIST